MVLGVALLLAGPAATATAVTPESPEVQKLIKKALSYLDKHTSEELGGKCLIALAYLKTTPPQPNHPRVRQALEACREGMRKRERIDMYSNGLAVIFLCEQGGRRNADLVNFYLNGLKQRQKDHGGWGYDERKTGDTSQTQYAALSYWEAHNNGFSIGSDSVEQLSDWLMRTQDPNGAWGYQGQLGEGGKRVKQSGITCSMLAAGMGSMFIAADLFGLLDGGADGGPPRGLPSGVSRKGEKKNKRSPNLRSSSLDRKGIFASIKRGNAWMDKNYKESLPQYTIYYLYSLERYRSFEEKWTRNAPREPEWYVNGYKYLKQRQSDDGSWSAGCGRPPDTAFAVLFLVRSTRAMLRGKLSGVAIGTRGLPKYTPGLKLVEGQFVIEQTEAAVSDLLNMLDDDAAEKIDQLANNPTALVLTGELDEAAEQRLRQVVRGGSPGARLLAVRTLGRTGKLDHVPTLIYAMTDPDRRVTLEARDALRFVSRRFEGFGLADNFTDRQRYEARDKWKSWYLSIKPGAVISIE
ncbi:MAG: prenyltransferase/squalene oxidase repeat-containing protein [Planctomycetota bacterium]